MDDFEEQVSATTMNSSAMGWFSLICGSILCIFLAGLAGTILWMIWTEKIDLTALVSETNGDASMSRFQLLVFTFVIAMSIFMMVEKNGTFPIISDGVLTLLGISASTYAVGKGISYSRDEGVTDPTERTEMRTHERQLAATQLAVTQITGQEPPAPAGTAPTTPPIVP